MPPLGLYPRTQWRPTLSYAEKRFYDALKRDLPATWIAWHSLRVRHGGRESECDFVVAIPDLGLLLVEVKGGRVEVKDGRWWQDGRELSPSPRDQALRFRGVFLDKLAAEYAGKRPFVQIITAFPQTPFVAEPSQGDLAGAVLGEQDLANLAPVLLAMAVRLFHAGRAPSDLGWVDAVHSIWGETWTPSLTFGDTVRVRAEEMASLDRDQLRFLDFIEHNPRQLVVGGPGTGKTLLARHLYRRRTAAGGRVLYLCWTRALAMALRRDGIPDAWPVRELALDRLRSAGVQMQGGAAEQSWTTETWESVPRLASGIVNGKDKHDLVIVDEAQDLTENDWALVNVLAVGAALWAFGDEAQGFWTDRKTPDALFSGSFRLVERYRCPEALARFADQYRPRGHGAPEPPAGRFSELTVVKLPSPGSIPGAVATTVTTLLEGGAKPGHIAVLSLAGQTKTELCLAQEIGDVQVVRADAEDVAEHVVADTFLRFKGLERPWILVVELARGQASRYDVRMHIALTRATVGAVVLGTAEEIAADSRLMAAR